MTNHTHRIVNGERVDLTPEEIAEREAQDAAHVGYPETEPPAPTKEQVMVELAALTAKIQALE
jgi:hypothetical protein